MSKRILIVDDEPLALQKLSRYLSKSGQEFIIQEANNGIAAVEAIEKFKPDIIFLDIQMPGLSGFEVLQQFAERPFLVVFQTAFDEFAIQAFEEHACGYLLKPFTFERFQKALTTVLARATDQERLQALEEKLSSREGYLQRLTVKYGSQIKILSTQQIACFISKNHYTCVYFDGKNEGITELSLSYLIKRLDPMQFSQFHRNNIAQLSAINGLSTTREGEMFIDLINGMKLPISRSNRSIAKKLILKSDE